MTLIRSISGIRGTIGGKPGEGLSPLDAVRYASAYARWVVESHPDRRPVVVVGRDARLSGPMLMPLVVQTLRMSGVDVIDAGLSTTPTVEMGVVFEGAQGGIIMTASHNPRQWNALKLLNHQGEFISAAEGAQILAWAEADDFHYADVDGLGSLRTADDLLDRHIEAILALDWVDRDAIANADFKVAVDAVNSSGGIAVPALLRALGVQRIEEIHCEPHGEFAHNPEPLQAHLGDLLSHTAQTGCDLGIAVDPDVDRLALVTEQGVLFGEEYTLVACADYVLSQEKGPAVSNLSSSRALSDVCAQHGVGYFASAVGEVHVVEQMKKVGAVIGGEGNGGVIVPRLHYGRDALVGIALFLTHLAKSGQRCSELRARYPEYAMSKQKIELNPGADASAFLQKAALAFANERLTTVDGVKVDFSEGWVHLRASNTEPIVRIYAEAPTLERAEQFVDRVRQAISTES